MPLSDLDRRGFLQASAILRAAEPVKAEVRDKLTALLDR